MNILFFDTETTGLYNFRASLEDPLQPNLVQLAAMLHDEDRNLRASINLIIKPEGWEIPESASDVHGITTEKAKKYGVPLLAALRTFIYLVDAADLVVAHNIGYDEGIIRTAHARQQIIINLLDEKMKFCTMKASTDILQIPGPYGFKWPNLQEAHRYFTGTDFDGARCYG